MHFQLTRWRRVTLAATVAAFSGFYIASDIKRREACAAWARSLTRGAALIKLVTQQQQEAASMSSLRGEPPVREGLIGSVTRLIIQSASGMEVLTPSAQLQLASDKSFLEFLWTCHSQDILMRLFAAVPPQTAINIVATAPSTTALLSFCEAFVGDSTPRFE
ncbi:hypothetical protein FOZ62_004206, partial [Perkinsus olseni]